MKLHNMIRHFITVFLIFLILFTFVSCSDAQKAFDDQDYHQVISILAKKTNKTENDYFLLGSAQYEIGNFQNSVESYMIFLFLSGKSDNNREKAILRIIEKSGNPFLIDYYSQELKPNKNNLQTLFIAYYKLNNEKKIISTLEQLVNYATRDELEKLLDKYPCSYVSLSKE